MYLGHGAMFGAHGWDIDWFSMKHPLNPPDTDETHFAELIDLEHMEGKLAKAKAAAAIIYNRGARDRISGLIDLRRPDVAHLHNIYHHLSPSILVALKERSVPTVLTAHDLKLTCPSYKMLNNGSVCERCKGGKVWNLALHRCLKGSLPLSGLITLESTVHKALGYYSRTIDRIITPSLFYRDKLTEWGWDPNRIAYIPNFVARRKGEPTAGGGMGPLLYFGRLSEEKGIATLIRAAKLSGVSVRVAGTGPSGDELRALAAEITAPVEFVGYQAGTALEALVHDAMAVVLPSEWYENAPMSVMEAYQAGRPVAGAAIGGIPELIREDETGWTFPSGDVEALAALMRRIVNTPSADRDEMGHLGSEMVREGFGPDHYLERVSALYAKII